MRIARVLLSCSLAALAATAAAADVPPTASPVPLLWKVSDADNAVYLLGSFHLLKPQDYPLSRDVDAAFADAETVVFEIPPDEMASPALASQMARAALRADGSRLDEQLPAATARKLTAWTSANETSLRRTGLQAPMLQAFEPWFVGLTVSIVAMTRQGLDPRLGLDQHFAAQAKAAGKPTAGLETGAQQIAFLDGMDAAEQVQFLDEALDESGDGEHEVDRLHDAWRRGDAGALWSGMAGDMRTHYPRLYQRINVARNDAWVPKIAQRLAQPGHDDTLVVVGALHLLGSDGVVEKLRARGYRVERICSACSGR